MWLSLTARKIRKLFRKPDRKCTPGTTLIWLTGEDSDRPQMVSDPRVDVGLTAIVGAAGLTGTWLALNAGKTVAVANKETLVMAGPLVMELAAQKSARILPVDSEHSAIFQAIPARANRAEVPAA